MSIDESYVQGVQSGGQTESVEYEPVQKPTGEVVCETRFVSVRRTYRDAGVCKKEEFTESNAILVGLPIAGVPVAEVGAASRMTLNLGNFESVQIEVSVALPCYVEELQECYKAAKHFVDSNLNSEIQAIRDYRDSKNKGG